MSGSNSPGIGKNPGLIKSDKACNALEFVAYLLFFIVLIFAINNFNLYIGELALLSLMMLVVSRLIQPKAQNPNSAKVYARTTTPKQQNSITLGIIFSIVLFMGYYLAAPDLFGLPSSVFSQLTTVALGTILTVDLVYSTLQAIAEERFFRYAIVNRIAAYVKGGVGVWLAIVGSALIFWLFHIPRYFNDPIAQGLILVSGAGLAFIDFYYKRLIISTVGHMIWNLIVVIRPAIFPSGSVAMIGGSADIWYLFAFGITMISYLGMAQMLKAGPMTWRASK